MPSLVDDYESDKKPPAKRVSKYYAIRKCDSLKASAIFFHWDDCSFYVDVEENEGQVDYQSFDRMADAVKYVTAGSYPTGEQDAPNLDTTMQDASDEAKMPATLPADQSAKTKTIDDDSMILLGSKSRAKGGNAETSSSSRSLNCSPSSAARVSLKRSRKEASFSSPDGKKRKPLLKVSLVAWMSKANGERVPLYGEAADTGSDTEGSDVASTSEPANPALPISIPIPIPVSASKAAGKLQEKFEKKLQLLKEYKEVHGTCNVSYKKCTGRFKGIYNFLHLWRRKLKEFEQDPSNPELKADKSNLLRLTLLGVEAACVQRRTQWENNCNLLAEYKELYDSCVVPSNLELSSKFCNLHDWCYTQRGQLRNYEEDPAASKLDESQYKKLVDIGLEKAPEKRSPKLRVAGTSWEEMFEQLKRFKEENGHANVPKFPPTVLRNWVQNMRRHYDRLHEGMPSQLTDDRMAQMDALGFVFNVKVGRVSFDDRVVQWIEYRSKHGRDPPGSKGNALGLWVGKVQRMYVLHSQGEKTLLTQERIDKLNSCGFQWVAAQRYGKPTEQIP